MECSVVDVVVVGAAEKVVTMVSNDDGSQRGRNSKSAECKHRKECAKVNVDLNTGCGWG